MEKINIEKYNLALDEFKNILYDNDGNINETIPYDLRKDLESLLLLFELSKE